MKRIAYLLLLMVFTCSSACFASTIPRITLSQLQAKADLIVMAKVTKVVADKDIDNVTIEVDSYLKGKSPQTVYTFTLVTRGGLKDFDPSLKKGDTGVFFLNLRGQEGQVEKAYWGSVATFQKNHFESTAITPSPLLDVWRSHRVKRRQIQDIEAYERGFRKGLTGPPGLVDGSADFNLGHSDGMIAKMKKSPNQKDAIDGE